MHKDILRSGWAEGQVVGRFWYSEQADKQLDLFSAQGSPEQKVFLRWPDWEPLLYSLGCSTSPYESDYEEDPYPMYPDKDFLGFGVVVSPDSPSHP